MSTPHCFGSIQACATRWADVDAAGTPQAGADTGYVTDALIQLGVGVELEPGADITQKNGCGAVCQAFKEPDRIKRVTLSATFCELDSELVQLLVGGSVLVNGSSEAIGYELPTVDDTPKAGGVLEVWSKAWDGDSQAVLSANAQYFHFVFSHAKFSPGDFTIEEENFVTFPVNGFSTPNTSLATDGPFNDWPADVITAGGISSSGGWFFDDTIPTAQCGYTTVPAQ